MEAEGKSFRDLQEDERLKRLERNLKLTLIKRPNSSQLPASTHMSISGISTIHGDNPSSDLSYCSTSAGSSRASSVVLASSNNFRKKLSKNLKTDLNVAPGPSSAFQQSSEDQKMNEDRAMMPPPPAFSRSKMQSSDKSKQKEQAVNSTTKTSFSRSSENLMRDSPSVQGTSQIDHNASVQTETPKNVRVFKKWTVRLNDSGQIIIRGRLESGEQVRSKAVKRRLSSTIVVSVLNHRYHLLGDIHDVREELPEYIRGKFYNGFPMDWENVHQIWQGYVASGSSSQFRWPRPIADSDDDLRSDITDIAVSHPKVYLTNCKPTSSGSVPQPSQTAQEANESDKKREIRLQRKEVAEDSAVSIQGYATKAKTLALEASCKNTEGKNGAKVDDPSTSQNQAINENTRSSEIHRQESPGTLNLVPKWKINIIIDNLMNKNCSKEYIDKIIMAIDCFNELLVMPAPNSIETPPDEGETLNYNPKDQSDLTKKNMYSNIEKKAETLQNGNSSRLQHGRQSVSNSYSLESCSESEVELPSNHNTFICEQSPALRKINTPSYTSMDSQQSQNSPFAAKNFPIHSETIDKKLNDSTPVRLKPTRYDVGERSPKKPTPTTRRKPKTVFDSTDSDTETLVSDTAKAVSANHSSFPRNRSGRVLDSKDEHPADGRIINRGKEGAPYDSDISIVDTSIIPSIRPRVLSIQKIGDDQNKQHHQRETMRSDFSFFDDQNTDHSRANSLASHRIGDLSNNKTGSAAFRLPEQYAVRLTEIRTDEKKTSMSSYEPSERRKLLRRRKNSEIDTASRTAELPESDAENVSMRMSSRGRRILPPLDYWNGERVTLKGEELIYSPGTTHPASLSGNSTVLKRSLISPNTTAVSGPAAFSAAAETSNKSTTGRSYHSLSAIKSTRKSTRRIGGILSEIPPTSAQSMAPHRRRKIRHTSIQEDSDCSSGDDKIHPGPKRKKKRIN